MSFPCVNTVPWSIIGTPQTIRPPSLATQRWQDEQLGPLQQSVRSDPLAADLDRIQVMSVMDGVRMAIWLRLIGPGLSLNLELAAPEAGSTEGVVELSMKKIPENHRDMVEIEVMTHSYFGDLYSFVRQHGLHRWGFCQDSDHHELFQCLSWA